MPLVEIKDFNALINSKSCFYQLVKNKQEANEKLIEMSRNDDYTLGIYWNICIIKNIMNSLV